MMKRNLLFAAMTLIAAVWSLTASAQTDVTSTYLTNADFSSVDGWTAVHSTQYSDQGNGLIGTYQVRGEHPAATADETTHLATQYCFGLEARWSTNYAAFTQTTGTLVPGKYVLSYDVENTNATTTAATYENRFTVTVGSNVYTDESTEWMTGKSAWTTHTIAFDVLAESTITISLGYGTGSNNYGVGNTPALFVSNLKLTYEELTTVVKTDLEAKIAEATAFNTIVNDEDLTSAIADAQAVFDNDAATQEEVNTATSDLEIALTQANTSHDRTNLVTNPEFNDGTNGWTSTTGARNQNTASNQPFPNNPFWENWNGGAYTGKMYQTISDLPNGVYALQIYAFVNNFAGDGQTTQYVYANNGKTNLTKGEPTAYVVNGVVTDGTLEIGLEQTAATANWMGIDGARLFYLRELTAADYNEEIDALVDEAQTLTDENPVTGPALATAITAGESGVETAEEAQALIAQLKAAIAASKVSIAAAEKLAKMKALTEYTNFYTAEALETFKTYYGSWQAKYEEGTLTDEEVRAIPDINASTDWRANPVATADLLYSVWDCTPYDWTNYHVNTWSTEGNTDGSDFRVPFMEYWTGDGESLGEKTLTATLTDLTPGNYEVGAWVRVRMKNGGTAPTTGITMQVGEGEAVDVCTGAQIGTSPFYLDTFTATGTVGEDGVLTFKFNVAADNNISWMAFRDLVYTKLPDPVELTASINWVDNQEVSSLDELTFQLKAANLEDNGLSPENLKMQYRVMISNSDYDVWDEVDNEPVVVAYTDEPVVVDLSRLVNMETEESDLAIVAGKTYEVAVSEVALLDADDNVIAKIENTAAHASNLVGVEPDVLLHEATELALDEDAVAVGKLLEAINNYNLSAKDDEAKAALQAAVDQFKEDNKDQESDQTAKVGTDAAKWTGATGPVPDWAAPMITTYDGRTVALVENFNGSTGETTGVIFSQTITGLPAGNYKVAFYANANSTADRDAAVETGMADGADDVAYVFANDQKEFLVAHRAIGITTHGEYSFEMELTEADGGTITLGLGKDKAGTNWHTMQIKQLTWFTTAKAVYALDQEELTTVIAEATALFEDPNKTEGKEELQAAIDAGNLAMGSNWYNIPELEEIIANLRAAMETYKQANYFIDLTAGEYYIIDAETGYMMAAGHDYGTRGIVNEEGLDLILTPNTETRKVTIDTRVSNGGDAHYLGSNLYMDSTPAEWALEYQGFGFYITNGTQYINIDENDNLAMSDTPREWIIVTKEGVMAERMEELAEATATNPMDATFLLKDPNFNRNDQRVEAWTVEATNWNLSGGNDDNRCAESFHSETPGFVVSQLVEGAPAGRYTLTAQGFFRQDDGETEDAPVFFANGATTEIGLVTGGEDNMNLASTSFSAGNYSIEPLTFYVGEDGKLTVGVKTDATHQWVIWDNFQLTYYGEEKYTVDVASTGGAEISTDPAGDVTPSTVVTVNVTTEEGYTIDAVKVTMTESSEEVEVTETDAGVYTFVMPAADVTVTADLIYVDPNDYTYLIENPAYLHEGDAGTADYAGWTWSPAPGESGWKYRDFDEPMNLVTYSGNVNFSFEQTIPEVPAGQYRLSVYGFYRAGEAQEEADRVTNGDVTHNLNMFAEYGDDIITQPIMNLYEGAAEEDVTGTGNHCVVNGYTDLFVPNGASDSRDFYIAGYYRNDLIINITEAGEVKIGINHPTGMTYDNDYAPIGAWELYRLGDVPATELTYEYEGAMDANYEGASVGVEIDKILAAIGATEGGYTVYTEIEGERTTPIRGDSDGWRNADGVFTGWSADGSSGCAYFVQDNGTDIVVGRHPALIGTAGDYTAKLVYVNNETLAELPVYIHLTYPGAEVIDYSFSDLNVLAEDKVDIQVDLATYYQGKRADADVAAIFEALGVESLDELDIFAVQSDGTLDANYKLGATDGWRDAQGDWKGHGAEAYFYVKADFSAASTQIYDSGTIPETVNTNVDPTAPAIYTAKYAFVVKGSETHDAFVLSVVLNYGDTTGIESLIADKNGEQTIYDLSGRRVRTITKGGMYIVNGKKVFVK